MVTEGFNKFYQLMPSVKTALGHRNDNYRGVTGFQKAQNGDRVSAFQFYLLSRKA